MDNNSCILIVDDEPLNLQMVAENLAGRYTIFLSKSGEEALAFLSNRAVDLVLLDVHMPTMNGFETAARIHQLSLHAETPIIYLTADTSEETISNAFDTGAVDYIVKPFKQKELLARVKNRLHTQRLTREQSLLLEHNERLMQIIKAHVAYARVDKNAIITEISQSFCDLFGVTTEGLEACMQRLIGQNINILKSGHTPKNVYRQLWQTILEGNVFTHRVENRNFNGNTHWYIVTIAPDINQYGDINGYISFYQDIDDEVALETNAAIDYLTGLYNRATFDTKLSEEIARAQCHLTPLTVILVDIDHFKYVNDAYGHEIGDLVLRDIASILTQHARQNDLVARWGGEEFVVLCPNTDAIGASQLAQILRTNIEQHVFHKVGHKTASFGVADYQIDMDQQTLFNHADAALYQAKETGRNQVVVFSSIAH